MSQGSVRKLVALWCRTVQERREFELLYDELFYRMKARNRKLTRYDFLMMLLRLGKKHRIWEQIPVGVCQPEEEKSCVP